MGIKDYKAPRAEVIEVNIQNVLCGSDNGDTENFTLGNSYGEDDWE